MYIFYSKKSLFMLTDFSKSAKIISEEGEMITPLSVKKGSDENV